MRCKSCGIVANDLGNWNGERLCWECDDMLAEAIGRNVVKVTKRGLGRPWMFPLPDGWLHRTVQPPPPLGLLARYRP